MIKLNKDAAINDYESAIKIISQVQDMHVEWRPDIYKYNNNLIPTETFEKIVENNTFLLQRTKIKKLLEFLKLLLDILKLRHMLREILFL